MDKRFPLREQQMVSFAAISNPERAKTFYRDTLGLTLLSEELPFALVFDANGSMLRLTIVDEFTPASYTVLGWRVPVIAEAVIALKQAGVQFERYPGMEQDDLGIWTAPGGAKVAWFKDPDGNVLSVSHH